MEVGFGKHDDRNRFRFEHQGQVSLQSRRVEILVTRTDNENGIHIGGDQLRLDGITGRLAGQDRFSFQPPKGAMVVRVQQQPVPDRERLPQSFVYVRLDEWRRNRNFSRRRQEQNVTSMMGADPTGNTATEFVKIDLLIEMWLPTKFV